MSLPTGKLVKLPSDPGIGGNPNHGDCPWNVSSSSCSTIHRHAYTRPAKSQQPQQTLTSYFVKAPYSSTSLPKKMLDKKLSGAGAAPSGGGSSGPTIEEVD
ncbi:hypothetical protein AOXY_G6687 [Acipenser oxyrinchus oxyrinchus]|uniref:Uncharacterized protein n=1 Tax=Acipenser oxyrinchus oxyrinchus TaxID=40147 RepID=A0AAD8LRI1_ACIOX|nr:hypothetical protein AOXY_G6687 [Acipenser oxyrinchus oxyrinchus]